MHEQTQRPEALRPGTAEDWPAGWKWALAAILLATAVVFVAGATSRIVLGDKVYHTMFARARSEAMPRRRAWATGDVYQCGIGRTR